MTRSNNGTTSPIKRIYFYHVRKAGGTMTRKYLRKVASQYRIYLCILEYKHTRTARRRWGAVSTPSTSPTCAIPSSGR
jgi:hypothetical protein